MPSQKGITAMTLLDMSKLNVVSLSRRQALPGDHSQPISDDDVIAMSHKLIDGKISTKRSA